MKHDDAPTRAACCRCPEPVGDPREGQCVLCGHQVAGYEIPAVRVHGIRDESMTARKKRAYRPAP